MTPDNDYPLLLHRFLEDHPAMSVHIGYHLVPGDDESKMALDIEATCAFLVWYVECMLVEKPEQIVPLIQACQEAEQTAELPPLLQSIMEELATTLMKT